MLLKKTNILFILFLFCAKGTLWAQGQTDLNRLINKALEENYQIRIVRNWEQMAQNNNTIGNAGFLPSVNVRGDQLWGIQTTEQRFFSGDTRSGDNARSSRMDAIVELDWTVFDGFRMFAQRDRLQYLEQLSKSDTRYYIDQTIADVSTLYYQLLTEKRILRSFERTLEISEFRLRLEEQKRQLGTGNALLYQQALIDFNADKSAVTGRKMIIRDIELQINRIISASADYSFQTTDTTIHLTGFEEREVLLEQSMQNNRDLERARIEELIAETNLRIERSARYPQISVFGNYSYATQTNEVGFIESSTSYGGQYGVRLRFNLYNGGRQNIRINNTLLEQQSANFSAMDTRSMVEIQLASLENRYNAFLEQYRLLEQSFEAAQNSLSIAREQLQAGMISGFEFRQAQMNSIRVENQMSDLLFNLKAIEIDIMRITGEISGRML